MIAMTNIFVNKGQSGTISWWYRDQLGTTESLFTKALTYIPGLRKWNALNF